MSVLIGTNGKFNINKKYGQVYLATHDGEGNRLPFVNRAYISFSYGGKYIEDFNLLVTLDGQLNKNAYTDFEDSVSDYETLDGQYYWGTRMKPNQLEFTLSTDGMTQNDMENFKRHFRPGVERELILAEHPNRGIIARVATVPVISMIPFETTINVEGVEIVTALYKGSIKISFVMNEPYWYGRLFYMPEYLDLETFEGQEDESAKTETMIDTKNNKDCLKICLEDNLPFSHLLAAKTFYGNNNYVSSVSHESAAVDRAVVDVSHIDINNITTGSGIEITNVEKAYVFYSGTAPSKPTISFTVSMVYTNDYITYNSGEKIANISIGDKTFIYGLPALFSAYNTAIDIYKNNSELSAIEMRDIFKEQLKESHVRAKAIESINSGKEGFINKMKSLFVQTNNSDENENNNPVLQPPTATYIINSETGEARGIFNINSGEITQNVGDMIRSEYLILDNRSDFLSNELIVADFNNIKTSPEQIISSEEITNFLISFKNMYL